MSVWPIVRRDMSSKDGLSSIFWREGDPMECSMSQGRTYRDGKERDLQHYQHWSGRQRNHGLN